MDGSHLNLFDAAAYSRCPEATHLLILKVVGSGLDLVTFLIDFISGFIEKTAIPKSDPRARCKAILPRLLAARATARIDPSRMKILHTSANLGTKGKKKPENEKIKTSGKQQAGTN